MVLQSCYVVSDGYYVVMGPKQVPNQRTGTADSSIVFTNNEEIIWHNYNYLQNYKK